MYLYLVWVSVPDRPTHLQYLSITGWSSESQKISGMKNYCEELYITIYLVQLENPHCFGPLYYEQLFKTLSDEKMIWLICRNATTPQNNRYEYCPNLHVELLIIDKGQGGKFSWKEVFVSWKCINLLRSLVPLQCTFLS